MVPRCPSVMFPVEGSCCGRIEQDAAVGAEPPELSALSQGPFVVVRPPRPGGLAASQLGWGAPWRMGPVGRVAGACVPGRCPHALLSGRGFEGFVPPSPVRAAGRLRVPLAVCPRRAVPHGSGPVADPGREASDELDAPSVAWWGTVWGAACRARSARVGMAGMCAHSVRGLLDQRGKWAADDVCWASGSLGPQWPLSMPS